MTITVYAKPGCPPCAATIRLLDKLGLVHVKLDVTTDAEALEACKLLGYGSTPVVVVSSSDSDQHWSGFRPERLAALVA